MFGVLVAIFLLTLIIWFKYSLTYWERRGVPGPKPWPIIGNIGPHLLGKKSLGEVMKDIYRRYEDYPFVGIFRATKPVLLLRDPDLVNAVLAKNFKSFRNNEIFADKETDPILAYNPFMLKDQEWKETRQMISPGLTSGKMKNMYPLLQEIGATFVKYIENHPTASTVGIETRGLTKRLTVDNVAKSAFGIDGKSFESYEEISEFNKLANQFLSPGTLFTIFFSISQIFPVIAKFRYFKFVSPDVESKLIHIISEVTKHRKENQVEANDYLQFIIDLGKNKNLENKEITSHACTFFIDGYITSSLVLSFLLLNLAQNPEYQEKIRTEIKKYEKENNGELTFEALHEMPWLNACFYESLRCTPPFDQLPKICNEPFEYVSTNPDFKNSTVKLVPGDIVIIPYGFCCTDPRNFKSPDKFMPERMFEKDSVQKLAFIPFGAGSRSCIGQRLGVMQTKLGAALILKHFELSVSPKLKQPITYEPFHPLNEIKGGIWIRYKKIIS